MMVLFVLCLGVKIFCAVGALYMFSYSILSQVKVTNWPPIGKIAAYSAYDMFSRYKYLIVNLVFSHLGFWSGIERIDRVEG